MSPPREPAGLSSAALWRALLIALCLFLVSCAPKQGVYHPVKKGQTLYRIGKAYGVDSRYLARINGIDEPTRLPAGRLLFVPGARTVRPYLDEARRVRTPPSSPPVTSSAKPPAVKQSAPPSSKPEPAPKRTVAKTPPPKKEAQFIWPVKGKVIKSFGKKGREQNNGIEIQVPRKTAVQAAAPGRVSYSGNGIQGFGNLIILQHSDSFFTIYGYNDRNLVKTNDYVGRGEKIALSGGPADEVPPRLHFEIRYGKNAVDPTFYLP